MQELRATEREVATLHLTVELTQRIEDDVREKAQRPICQAQGGE